MSDSQKSDAAVRDRRGRFAPGHPHRWAPGQSGNPGGRPKGASFATALAKQAATGNGRADDKLVGMLRCFSKPSTRPNSASAAPTAGRYARSALGMRPNPDARPSEGLVRMSERDAKKVSLFCRAPFVRGRSRSLYKDLKIAAT